MHFWGIVVGVSGRVVQDFQSREVVKMADMTPQRRQQLNITSR